MAKPPDGGLVRELTVGVAVTAIWAAVQGAYSYIMGASATDVAHGDMGQRILAYAIPAVATGALAAGAFYLGRRERSGIAFFADRDELKAASGDLKVELADAEHAIAIWPGGTYVPLIERHALRKVQRLILWHPESRDLWAYAQSANTSLATAKARIREATRHAHQAGVEVRWHRQVWFNALICNSGSAQAYARIELTPPHVEATHRPQLVIPGKRQPEVLRRLEVAFETMWRQATGPTLLDDAATPLTEGWLEARLVALGFPREPARLAGWVHVLKGFGLVDQGSAEEFFSDADACARVRAVYKRVFGEARVLDPTGYCAWTPVIHFHPPESRDGAVNLLHDYLVFLRDRHGAD